MTTNQFEDPNDEKPLDPVLEKVRRKMIRLLAVSIGIILVALVGVIIAIVYKTKEVSKKDAAQSQSLRVPSDAPVNATVNLPAGFKVTSTALSGDRILFYGVTASGQPKAYVFDMSTASVIADITLGGQ